MNDKYLTVTALTRYIKHKIDIDENLKVVYLKGEISNFKNHSSGHMYFSIKDDNSIIKAIMFKNQALKLNFEPKEGMKILAKGTVSVYEAGGTYQIYVSELIEDGIGDLYKKYDGYLVPAIGIHPENVDLKENTIEALEELLKENKVVAIGEIGLDYNFNDENKEEQKELFNKQLDLAEKYNLPIIVHTRDSIQDCFDILKKRKLKGVIHCYSGSIEMAREFIKLGYKLGIGGVLTFKNAKLYQVVEQLDMKDIILETDSPFLSPEPYRGRKNKPSNVLYVAKRIAELKNIPLKYVMEMTTANVKDIFDI